MYEIVGIFIAVGITSALAAWFNWAWRKCSDCGHKRVAHWKHPYDHPDLQMCVGSIACTCGYFVQINLPEARMR